MYYSYVEIEYVTTSFSPARTDLALKLLSQGIAELLKGADDRRFSSVPDVVESKSDADS
jgi:hypothetical protein